MLQQQQKKRNYKNNYMHRSIDLKKIILYSHDNNEKVILVLESFGKM